MDFGELKNKFLSAVGQATDSAKGAASKAADKAKDAGRIAKLKMEIATEKENVKKSYLEIGKLYYDTHKDDPEGFFIQLCEEVALAEKAIADKEAEIAALKEGLNSSDEPDVSVEFEEVVSEAETAAETPVAEAAEAAETVAEAAEDAVEKAAEEVIETVEEAVGEIREAAGDQAAE